jgi:hypothetical protein
MDILIEYGHFASLMMLRGLFQFLMIKQSEYGTRILKNR